MYVPLLTNDRRWECPSCDLKQVTKEAQPHTRFHSCKGLFGITAPMVPEGTNAEHRAVEREDYINGEAVTLDGNSRPIMSVITTRDDGQDCSVMAPVAQVRGN